MSSDPVFTASLLKMANSSLYHRGAQITSIDRAVSVLGSRALRNLALCVAVRNCVQQRELGDFNLSAFWEDSLRRAVAARLFAESVRSTGVEPGEAFTGGLLQDLGVLALILTRPTEAGRWSQASRLVAGQRRGVERELFGTAHDDIADALIESWRLPEELAMPMRYHHRPAEAPTDYQTRCWLAAHAEAIASVLSADNKSLALAEAREQLETAKFPTPALEELIDKLGTQVAQVGAELEFDVGDQPSYEDVLQAANTGLVELNLSYEELVVRLEKSISEKDDLARQLAARNRELEQLCITDELTGLPNRRAMSGRLTYEIRQAANGGSLCFAVADIDKFKSVNDTWGHDFGDVVLMAVADAMRAAGRDADLVARIGGEEFGFVLPATDLEAGRTVAEGIRRAVEATKMATPDDEARNFTISIGLVSIQGPANSGGGFERIASRLYKAADAALYRAKHAGRNRLEVGEAVRWRSRPRPSNRPAS